MRGFCLKGFFKCSALSSAPDGCVRKREKAFPLPHVKRQKLLGSMFPQQAPGVVESGEDNSSEEDVDVPSAPQGREVSSLYPSVAYEGDIANVKLGVGQMVILDGCAMVQVVEGQVAMLGYSFPSGTDVLVCSNSKPAEMITIEARLAPRDGRSRASDHGTEVEDGSMREGSEEIIKNLQEVLGCELRFTSHSLGQQMLASEAGYGRSLSFRLEFVGSLGSTLGKKRRRQFLEQQNQDRGCPDSNEPCSNDDQLNMDLEAGYFDIEADGDERDDQLQVPVEDVELAATKDSVKKRKGLGQNTDNVKRQRVVEMLDSDSSATSIPHDWKEAVESTITLGSGVPVVAVAVQRLLESLRLLGSKNEELAYLDADDGQTEFTGPGCVSLHIFDSPTAGPPAMHCGHPRGTKPNSIHHYVQESCYVVLKFATSSANCDRFVYIAVPAYVRSRKSRTI